MRVFVTGWDGLLGRALVAALDAVGHAVEGFGVGDADIGDRPYLARRLDAFRPDWVAHLAAMTAVDRAESEPDETFRVNVEGTRGVAREASRTGAAVLLLSTDYVFDGSRRAPYREEDPPNPLGVYGRSKLAAEEVLRESCSAWGVVRSAWLFGPGGKNFVDTVLERLEKGETCRVVDDQRGSPTYAPDLAAGLVALMAAGLRDTVHLVNRGEASWYQLAGTAAERAGYDRHRIEPATTEEIGRPAPRPRYSVLDASLARTRYRMELRPWGPALEHYIAMRAARASGEAR